MYSWLATVALATQALPLADASSLDSRAIIKLPSNRIPHEIETPDIPPNPIRGGGSIVDSPPPKLGDAPASGYKAPVPLLRSADDLGPNALQEGTADKTMHLCRNNRKGCEELIETAADLMFELFGQLADDDDEPTSTSTATATTPASSKETGEVRVGRPETKGSVKDLPIPNLNMSTWMSGSDYRSVYTKDEFELLRFDPVCFFASQERLYRAYAQLSNQTSPSSSPKEKRNCYAVGTECKNYRSTEDKASDLYLSYLPDQISQVYMSTPTQVTVEGTSTTKCPSFTVDTATIEAFETQYAVFGWREGEDPKETESQDSGMTAPTGSVGEIKSTGASVSGGVMALGLAVVAAIFTLL